MIKSSVYLYIFLLSFQLEAYDWQLIRDYNPKLFETFQFVSQLELSRPVTIAVLGTYIHIDEFRDIIDMNENEQERTFRDDDGNGYIDDVYTVSMTTGHGRRERPLFCGHENGIVSLLDALIRHFELVGKIKILPISIEHSELRFDDQFIKKVADAIDYARYREAEVVSMSFGISHNLDSFFQFIDNDLEQSRQYFYSAIQNALKANMILVGASSNNPVRNQFLDPQLPANAPGVISVSNVNYEGVMQSAYGDNTDTAFYGTDMFVWNGEEFGYAYETGASYATPLVAFTLALDRSLYGRRSFSLLRRQVRNACDRALWGPRNVASRCIFSPEHFLNR